MRIALFGGSFNPPHVAHQMAALHVLETSPVDELWFVPCYKHPFDKPLEPFDERFRMCELVAAALGTRARVSDIERVIGDESRTLRTVQALQARHPEHHFSLVIGSDLVGEIDSWFGAVELRRTVPFLVVGRAGGADAAPSREGGTALPARALRGGRGTLPGSRTRSREGGTALPARALRGGRGTLPGSRTTSVEMPAVSSTQIRQSLREGKPVQGLVPRTVLDYIYQRGLFQAREPA